MKPELTVKVGGADVVLRLPLGGLEDIAEVNPSLAEVALGLGHGLWRLAELKAVLSAGLKWGGSGITVETFLEATPLAMAASTAARLMQIAFTGVDPGEPEAAGTNTPSE